ncbi:hypothetical protein PROFUN_07258 [Planoprotostelium fungivorum]|uniref:Ras-GAP domain-containing protein n=1 Tax=Planoprotostelium fungivorum TaxID=1890364 RepID=A0A2P6NM79_9EUKA|nr:hypothetical protein PROFUN_07258 [Planoprotostelium fungivorum]
MTEAGPLSASFTEYMLKNPGQTWKDIGQDEPIMPHLKPIEGIDSHAAAAEELRAQFAQCPPWDTFFEGHRTAVSFVASFISPYVRPTAHSRQILVKLRDEMRRRRHIEQQWLANSEKMTQYMEQLSLWKQSVTKQLELQKAKSYDFMTELQQNVASELQNLREQLHEREEELKAKDALLLEKEAMIRGKGSKINRLTQMMANSDTSFMVAASPANLGSVIDPEDQFMISDWRVRWLDPNLRPLYLVQLLFKPEFPVLGCILDNGIRVQDDFISALLNMAETRNDTSRLFRYIIRHEVDDTKFDAKETLFRSNTLATKIMTMYTTIYGLPYLTEILQPFMMEITHSNESYEIDPNRKSDGEDLEANMKKLTVLVQSFVDRVIGSKAHMPMQFRQVCNILVEQVTKKFPDDAYSGVKSFIFLRYFCPALMTPPKEFNTEIRETSRRTLVLVSKIFQNSVNGAELKEPFMLPLNDFVKANSQRLKAFITDISTLTEAEMSTPVKALDSNVGTNNSLKSIETTLTTIREPLMEKLRIIDSVVPQTMSYRVTSRLNVVCSLLGPYKKGGLQKLNISLSDPRVAEVMQLILEEDQLAIEFVEIMNQDKERDKFFYAVVFVLMSKNPKKFLKLMRHFIHNDIIAGGALDSTSKRLLTQFSYMACQDILKSSLSQLMDELVEQKEELKANSDQAIEQAHRIIQSSIRALNACPTPLSQILRYAHEELYNKFGPNTPALVTMEIIDFYIHNVTCKAMDNPDDYGLGPRTTVTDATRKKMRKSMQAVGETIPKLIRVSEEEKSKGDLKNSARGQQEIILQMFQVWMESNPQELPALIHSNRMNMKDAVKILYNALNEKHGALQQKMSGITSTVQMDICLADFLDCLILRMRDEK